MLIALMVAKPTRHVITRGRQIDKLGQVFSFYSNTSKLPLGVVGLYNNYVFRNIAPYDCDDIAFFQSAKPLKSVGHLDLEQIFL